MKFFKFLKNKNNGIEVGSMSDADIESLAIMCYVCKPKVSKKGFITRYYAYYITESRDDLEIAKEVFIRNGIPVQEHMSNIMSLYKQEVLRVDYEDIKNQDKLKQVMEKIDAKRAALYTLGKMSQTEQKQTQR